MIIFNFAMLLKEVGVNSSTRANFDDGSTEVAIVVLVRVLG